MTHGAATLFAAVLCNHDSLAAVAVKTMRWLKHTASDGVAVLRNRASKIVNSTTAYYAASLLHVCTFVLEKMCWRLVLAMKKIWLWVASFGESYNGDMLHFAKQLLLSGFHK